MAPSKKSKVALAGAFLLLLDDAKKKKKRVWMKDWLKNKSGFSHMKLMNTLSIQEPEDLHNFLRMDNNTFLELLELIRPTIEKKETWLRETISAEDRLVATLKFLATGIIFFFIIKSEPQVFSPIWTAFFKLLKKLSSLGVHFMHKYN